MDDLGAGYNALSILADLQPKFIKIDMSIVRNCDTEQRKQRLVDLLANSPDATGAKMVAEGVETDAEAVVLRKCGHTCFKDTSSTSPQSGFLVTSASSPGSGNNRESKRVPQERGLWRLLFTKALQTIEAPNASSPSAIPMGCISVTKP